MTTTEHDYIADDLRSLAFPVANLKLLPGNPRRGDVDAVARSYDRFGQRKPIVARRSDMTVIAGNHQLQAAQRLGWTHVAVVWTDDDDLTAKAYALADNRVSDLGIYNDELLVAMLQEVAADQSLFEASGYDPSDLQELLDNASDAANVVESDESEHVNPYTQRMKVPQYEIVGEEPAVEELYDDEKAARLRRQIEATDLPDDVRNFLLLAANRHVVFNYRKVAEYYAHQQPDIQRLMEASALIIIDYDDAIAHGFVRFQAAIQRLRVDEHVKE